MVHVERRIGAEKPLGSRYLWQEAFDQGKGSIDDIRYHKSTNSTGDVLWNTDHGNIKNPTLGYVSRAVCPSVSYNNAKRTIPRSWKATKTFTIIGQNNERIAQTSSKTKESSTGQIREIHSRIASSMVHVERRIGAEKPLGSRYLWQEAFSIKEKEAPMT